MDYVRITIILCNSILGHLLSSRMEYGNPNVRKQTVFWFPLQWIEFRNSKRCLRFTKTHTHHEMFALFMNYDFFIFSGQNRRSWIIRSYFFNMVGQISIQNPNSFDEFPYCLLLLLSSKSVIFEKPWISYKRRLLCFTFTHDFANFTFICLHITSLFWFESNTLETIFCR